jgi:hypothetical protein
MMKRFVILATMALVLSAGLFALDLSAGGGTYFAQTYGYEKVEGEDAYNYVANSNFGVYGFFDATYAELGLSLGGYNYGGGVNGVGFNGANVGFNLYGKFPFAIGSIRLSPMLGLDSQLGLSYLDSQLNELPTKKNGLEKDDAVDYYNSAWIKFGAAVDVDLPKSLYLRTTLLYGFKFYSSKESDMKDDFDVKDLIYSGPTFRIAVGYKFASL